MATDVKAAFIGKSALVTLLRTGNQLRGTVDDIEPGTSLTLRDVLFHDGTTSPREIYHTGDIKELELAANLGELAPHPQPAKQEPHPQAPLYQQQQQQLHPQYQGGRYPQAQVHQPPQQQSHPQAPIHHHHQQQQQQQQQVHSQHQLPHYPQPYAQHPLQPHHQPIRPVVHHAPVPPHVPVAIPHPGHAPAHIPMPMAPQHRAPAPLPAQARAHPFNDPAIRSMSRPMQPTLSSNSNNHLHQNQPVPAPAQTMPVRIQENKVPQAHASQHLPTQRHTPQSKVHQHQATQDQPPRKLEPGIIPVSLIPEATMLPAPSLPRRTSGIKKMDVREDVRKITPAAVLVDPMEKLALADDNLETDAMPVDGTDVEVLTAKDKRRNNKQRNGTPRRNQRARGGRNGQNGTDALQTNPAEGWRKTPLLRPNHSFQPFSSLEKGIAAARRKDENGWETNDATDVQELEEFDFQASLKMFDKRADFKRFREQDMTADEDTCVGMNRLESPLKSKNFGPTENVLEPRRENVNDRRESMNRSLNGNVKMGIESPAWNSEGSESDDENDLVGSGRVSRARGHTGSGAGSGAAMSNRGSRRDQSQLRTSIGPGGKRPESSGLGKSVHNSSQTRQPRKRTSASAGPRSISKAKTSVNESGRLADNSSAFYLVPANTPVHVASALEMMNVENVASELGLTEDEMTGHAGRGIADIALKIWKARLGNMQGKRVGAQPIIVVLAGNNKSGVRAIAAGRLLRKHGVDVVVCLVGLDRELELLDGVRRQLKLFRVVGQANVHGGAVVRDKASLMKYLTEPPSNFYVELVIDGLMGLTTSFQELVHRPGELHETTELIKFGKRGDAGVLAIDVPSGLNPITGQPMLLNDMEVGWLNPDFVVSMGVPKTGLLGAMRMGLGSKDEDGKAKWWKLSLVDIGIGRELWESAGMEMERVVEFEGQWVLGMRFQKGE